jgi:hypothetical protein
VRIQLKRSGGFAGLTRTAEVDSEELPEEAAHRVRQLADEGRLDELAAREPERPSGADRYQYELVVEGDEAERRILMHDGAIPDDLRPLVDQLIDRL